MERECYVTKLKLNRASLWKKGSPFLKRLDIELTERCNNNCIHCYINLPVDSPVRGMELSTREIRKILKQAVSLGCLTVRFTGGEPLLREDFEELYLFARRLGFRVLLLTNATLITPHLAELFARIPPLAKIEITVYGMKEKSYETVTRVPGSFEAAQHGIERLLKKKVPFVVKGALLPPNRGEIAEFEQWASTIPWMVKPPTYSMFFDLRCRRDSEERNFIIKGLRLSPEEGLEILLKRQDEYLRRMKEFCSKCIIPAGDKLFSCGAGIGCACLDAYGHLQPCMMLRHPDTVYDLKRGSLKDALTNFFPNMRKMKAGNRDYLMRCARCSLKGFCKQCPARSWMEHGTLDTPVEYFCKLTHMQARYLGLLKENETAWKIGDGVERIRHFAEKQSVCSTTC